jgi:hypothetical protein
MSPAALLDRARAMGLELVLKPDGGLRCRAQRKPPEELLQQLSACKTELVILLSGAQAAVPPWDQARADQLLSALQAEVEQLRRARFADAFPEPLASVVATYLDVAASYVTNHEAEVARGWDPWELLRYVQPRLREIIERVGLEQ